MIEAGGRTLLPGFFESHLHLVLGGAELEHLQLGEVAGFDALASAVRAYGAARPDLPLLMAQGANYEILGAPVTRHDLDRISADRPLAMMAPDHHTVWANTMALQRAGMLHGMVTPSGHEVVMAADGTATGELREFEAFGPLLFDPERFKAICTEIDRRGLQIAVHAIGDGAVRVTIDGYQAAAQANGLRDLRHRIEHIELIDRADQPRLAALDITASVQPPHPPGALHFPMSTMAAIFPPERWPDAYRWKSLDARLAFASDWPVTEISVLMGLQAALTRVPYAGAADERLGLMDSLHADTAGGAIAAHREALTGRLVPGLSADLVLLGGDIEAVAAQDIGAMGIAKTVAGGRVTHRTAGFA